MATVQAVLPKGGAKKFRDGCTKHWQVRPNPSERKLGVAKETLCRQGPAEARAGEVRHQIHRGVYVTDDKTTVAEWAEKWLTGKRLKGLRPASIRILETNLRLRIVPALGARRMTSVRPEHVRDAATGWVAYGPAATRLTTTHLREMFKNWAEDGRPLPHGNPVQTGLLKQPLKQHVDPLTVAQVQAWRDALPEDMRPLVDVQSYFGARMSEVLGLREEDLAWTGRDMSQPLADQLRHLAHCPPERYKAARVMLRFDRQLGRRQFASGQSVGVPTKNRRARRQLPMPQWLTATLADHLTRWPAVDGWLFTNWRAGGRNGKAAHPRPYSQRGYSQWLSDAAAAAIPLPKGQLSHALRHHCVSVLRDQGFSDQAIGDWIGDTALTVQKTYGRPMPDSFDRMSAALDALHTGPRLRVVGDS
jgi:integrase